MRFEPKEEDRAALGELYLAGELMARDIAALQAKQFANAGALAARVKEIAGVEIDKARPEFDGYRLVALDVEVKEGDNGVS